MNTPPVKNDSDTKIIKDINSARNLKENNVNISTFNFSDNLANQFEIFASSYKDTMLNFIHFLNRQKEHVTFYLTNIQNEFLDYINRSTNKTEIAEIYKFNLLRFKIFFRNKS